MVEVELTEGEVILISGMIEHELKNFHEVEGRLSPNLVSTMDQIFASLSTKMEIALAVLGVDPV
jgi:hypothetical protein